MAVLQLRQEMIYMYKSKRCQTGHASALFSQENLLQNSNPLSVEPCGKISRLLMEIIRIEKHSSMFT